MIRVFLDANVLFSAADGNSATRVLLDCIIATGEAVASPIIVEEARRNLTAKRPALIPGLERLLQKIEISLRLADSTSIEGLVPAHDLHVLAGAIGARCTHLWTGDKRHFGSLYGRVIGGALIVSAIMLANELDI